MLQETKEIVMKLVKKSADKVDYNISRGLWDNEDLEVLEKAVKTWKRIEEIEDVEENHALRKEIETLEKKRGREGSEFKDLVYDIYSKNPNSIGLEEIIEAIDDTMEELKIIHEKVYDKTLNRLKSKK